MKKTKEEEKVIEASFSPVSVSGDTHSVSLIDLKERLKAAQAQERGKDRTRLAKRLRQARDRYRKFTQRAATKKLYTNILSKLDAFEKQLDQQITEFNQNGLDLILAIAKEVIGEEISSNRKALAEKLSKELSRLESNRKLKVVLNCKECSELEAEFKSGTASELNITFEPSEEISPGRVKIVTDSGEIIIDWQKQFSLISEKLSGRIAASNMNGAL